MSALIVAVLMAGLYAVYISAKNMTALALHKTVALAWASSRLEARRNGSGGYIDPSDDNMLAADKGGSVAVNNTSYGDALMRHSAIVTWTE